MAVSLNKLLTEKVDNTEIKNIKIGDQEIKVKTYLPMKQKSEMIEKILTSVIDDTGFSSPVREEIYFNIYLLKYYTNLSITDKMVETADVLYDKLLINGILERIHETIPKVELDIMLEMVESSIETVVKYNTSILGVMRMIQADSNNTYKNLDDIMSVLDQPDKINLVKEITEKIR